MGEDNHQKIKLLKLMELLQQDTDENHPITTSEICRRLGEMGISCERRTVGKDMKLLRQQGYLSIKGPSDFFRQLHHYIQQQHSRKNCTLPAPLQTSDTWDLPLEPTR